MMDDEIELTITLSKTAYERAAKMAQDADGIAGEFAGMLTTEEFIERYLEIMLEPETAKKASR
ncbi:hypothetical protein [Chelativorans multitrophicus]|uniref:hypothetical protein n=2 Tax=Chelativorans TaxID=449972 RepID=UPI00003A2C27|nr:hypothetical protein [Chelativorans multitrophicus]